MASVLIKIGTGGKKRIGIHQLFHRSRILDPKGIFRAYVAQPHLQMRKLSPRDLVNYLRSFV